MEGPAGKKRERQEHAGEATQDADRRSRKLEPVSTSTPLNLTVDSASKSPTSHPVLDSLSDASGSPAGSEEQANGTPRGDAYDGFVLKPLKQASAPVQELAPPASSLAKMEAPRAKERPSQTSQVLMSRPPKSKPLQPKQVPHSRLSFGEELDEEATEPESSFSMSHFTAQRFRRERELQLPAGNSLASPFSAVGSGDKANGHPRKSLSPLCFGVAQARGPRPYMEDRYTIVSSYTPLSFTSQPIPDDVPRSFAAVYDGHNGTKAAEYACSRLHMALAQEPALRTCTGEVGDSSMPWARQDNGIREAQESADMGKAVKRAFTLVDGEILDRARAEQGRDGATALVVLRIGDVIWAAHAGDSRAVLCRDGKAVRLTEDHKPEILAEKARVEAAGGKVDFQRCWRVICPARNGRPASGLAVSRSLGDLDFKEPSRFIECEPDVTRLRATDSDSFVVMASDGLWDVFSDQEAVLNVKESLAQSASKGNSRAALDARIKEAAEKLTSAATEKGSMDNITVLLLLLQWD